MNTLFDRRSFGYGVVADFRYPAIPSQRVTEGATLDFTSGPGVKTNGAIWEQELAAAVATAREGGFREGQAQASSAAVQAIEQERSAVSAAVADFILQRAEYFRRIEGEAVRLALSIVRKILHREAQIDPLLLAGVVRVALDQMQAGTRITLRTSPALAGAWSEFCSRDLRDKHTIEVVADPAMEGHTCALQAEVGSMETSLEAQLAEIEGGFFDLLRGKVAEQP